MLGQVGHGNRPLFHGFGTAVDPVSNLTVSLYEFRYSENQALEAFLLGLTRYRELFREIKEVFMNFNIICVLNSAFNISIPCFF